MIAQLHAEGGSSRSQDGLAVGVAVVLGAWACLQAAPHGAAMAGAVACVGLGATPLLGRDARIVMWFVAGLALIAAIPLPPVWPLAQVTMGLPVALAVWGLPALHEGRQGVALGRLDWRPVAAIGGVAMVALVAWRYLWAPPLDDVAGFVPELPLPLLVLGFVLFSVVNAVIEEVVFRGLLQGALESLLGAGALALVIQAALFGMCHWRGVPSGPIGALLAGSWAVMLGWARRRTGGLLTPVLAHVAADAAIFILLAATV